MVTVVAFTGWAVRLNPMSFKGTRFCNTSRRSSPIFRTVALGSSVALLLREGKIFLGKERIRPVRLRSRLVEGTDDTSDDESVVSADSDTPCSRSVFREDGMGGEVLYLLLCGFNDDCK